MKALKNELKQYLDIYSFKELKTVYIGGGTPGLKVSCLNKLLASLTSSITLSGVIEFTIECNPLNINEDLISLCHDFGCNRISMGVQSFSDKIVKGINRGEQGRKLLYEALDRLHKSNFNVSIDLINGLPGLEVKDEISALNDFLAKYSSINHLSFYDLSIDEGSKYYLERDKYSFPDETTLAKYELELSDTLLKYCFNRYEISNYSKKGFESKHNLAYWKYKNYIGLGPGAHSTVGSLRVENAADIGLYITGRSYRQEHFLSVKEQIEEYLIMGLRLMEGISLADFKTRFGMELCEIVPGTIASYLKRGDVDYNSEGNFRLTEKGIDILNSILVDMFIELDHSF